MKKILVLILTLTLVLGISTAGEAFGASVSCSVSSGSCTVGGNVTVTVTISSSTQLTNAYLTISGYSGTLELVGTGGNILDNSGGQYLLYLPSGSTSLRATFTFKAVKAGTVRISASASEVGTFDEQTIAGASGSGTVTVAAASSGSTSSSKKTTSKNKRGEFTSSSTGVPQDKQEEEKEPEPKPEKVEVGYSDKTWTIVEDLKEGEIPRGFKAVKATYGEWNWEIVVYTDESGHMIICLEDKESGERQFFTYNDDNDSFGNAISVTVAEYLEIDKTQLALEKTQAQLKELQAKPNLLPALIAAIVVAVISLGAAIFAFIRRRRDLPLE